MLSVVSLFGVTAPARSLVACRLRTRFLAETFRREIPVSATLTASSQCGRVYIHQSCKYKSSVCCQIVRVCAVTTAWIRFAATAASSCARDFYTHTKHAAHTRRGQLQPTDHCLAGLITPNHLRHFTSDQTAARLRRQQLRARERASELRFPL